VLVCVQRAGQRAGHHRCAPLLAGAGVMDGFEVAQHTTNLTVPLTNNTAETAARPAKVQQRTSGGYWRALPWLPPALAQLNSYDHNPALTCADARSRR
jgi:hypothetical protein